MGKKSNFERENLIKSLIEKHKETRANLKAKIRNKNLSMEERITAMRELDKLPKSSSAVRANNRCAITSNTRGFYRFFQLSRHALRDLAARGFLPGVTRASW